MGLKEATMLIHRTNNNLENEIIVVNYIFSKKKRKRKTQLVTVIIAVTIVFIVK